MPDIFRIPTRMDCTGIDLVSPLDRMGKGAFPFLLNVRVVQEGRLESRPGYGLLLTTPASGIWHSIRRLNDTTLVYASLGFVYIGGVGTVLVFGPGPTLSKLAGAVFSGNPLSMIPFRPNNSPVAWMYIYDALNMVKVNPIGTLRSIGVAPPSSPPTVEYGPPSMAVLSDMTTTGGWVAYGEAETIAIATYSAGVIGDIVWQSAIHPPSWAFIYPNPGIAAPPRQRVIVGAGLDTQETVMLREIHPAIPFTEILQIFYDSGSSGPCSLVLGFIPTTCARNSLILVGSESGAHEITRVTDVIQSPDGQTSSIRCSLTGTYQSGQECYGLISWMVYLNNNHAVGESVEFQALTFTGTGAGTGYVAQLTDVNAAQTTDGRSIDPANDYLHISILLSNPAAVSSVVIFIDIDPDTTSVGASGNAFTNNYYKWTILPVSLNQGNNGWTDIDLPISQATRYGTNSLATFSVVKGIQVAVNSTAACSGAVGSIYFFGTYGPVILPNSPTGYLYQTVARDSLTGAQSVPTPAQRTPIFPLREEVVVAHGTDSSTTGVDSYDEYRQGGALTNFTYIGTNNSGVYDDTLADSIVAASPQTDLTQLQPWPIQDLEWSGTVTVIGTTVIWESGTAFNVNLVSGSVININGTDYQTYGQPLSPTMLFITETVNEGVVYEVPYKITEPTLAAQPLPFAFGPLEGPFAPVIFGLGDPKNAGTLYYSNTSNADSASDQNTIELCSPSEPLISGDVWNGLVICGSRDNLFLVRYSYLTTLGVSSNTTYQFSRLPSPSGIWSMWACKRGPNGVYFLGRDGIYLCTDQGAENISDEKLYPLFPHDGIAGIGANGLLPVDMTRLTDLRISTTDFDVRFNYYDISGASCCLRYEIARKRWFAHSYGDNMTTEYLVENSSNVPNDQEILVLSRDQPNAYRFAAGSLTNNSDNGIAINSVVTTPAMDTGDERLQKLFVDLIADLDGTGEVNCVTSYNDMTVSGSSVQMIVSGLRQQFYQNLSSLASLKLYRNISIQLSWKGGPTGPRVYAVEPSGYVQPYLSTLIVTQYITLAVPGWKHHRRLYAGIISNSIVLLTIMTQDGRTYGPIQIPSSGGQFRIFPLMLPQGIKDLAFAYQLDGQGQTFALFQDSFTIEIKEWNQDAFQKVQIFRT